MSKQKLWPHVWGLVSVLLAINVWGGQIQQIAATWQTGIVTFSLVLMSLGTVSSLLLMVWAFNRSKADWYNAIRGLGGAVLGTLCIYQYINHRFLLSEVAAVITLDALIIFVLIRVVQERSERLGLAFAMSFWFGLCFQIGKFLIFGTAGACIWFWCALLISQLVATAYAYARHDKPLLVYQAGGTMLVLAVLLIVALG